MNFHYFNNFSWKNANSKITFDAVNILNKFNSYEYYQQYLRNNGIYIKKRYKINI